MAGEDFKEEEVWSILKEKIEERDITIRRAKDQFSNNNVIRSNVNAEKEKSANLRKSIPVMIPDWSKIYGNKSSSKGSNSNGNASDEFDDTGSRVPPHEWIAKKLARSQVSSFSVCEGAGRTLKGRDQCKLRDAVLTRTGFLE